MPTPLSAPLPDLDLEEKSILTIDTGDASAIITQVVIHFSQEVPAGDVVFPAVPVLLGNAPNE